MNQQQGTIFSKIAMPIVIVAIVVYLICSAWVGIRDPYQFTVAYTDTMETSVDAAGWVVRSEQPVAGAEGVVQAQAGPGREGGQGNGVAVVYQDETYVENQEELLQVKNDLSALQYATYSESPSGTALEDQMLSAMTSLRTCRLFGQLQQPVGTDGDLPQAGSPAGIPPVLRGHCRHDPGRCGPSGAVR